MKIEKNIIEKIANGETSLTGEPVDIAKRIVENNLQSKFKSFAFFYKGDGNKILDVQDCLLDFKLFGAEITVIDVPENIHPTRKLQIFGMTFQETLKDLFYELTLNPKKMFKCECKKFTINGVKGKFKISYTALHYCFGEGSISVEECMAMMRI
ncbi:hypothetical protein H6A66_14610 [Bacteroides caecigallinarum]|uniref:hypothetical protein n=1 Tax=Bacteroides caecigallinarum TaxID=1411144 RepID=UPI0019573D68|nr:hypothetical protein [Bacteroides caecigallinarum]MBM6866389.1 hypothetical protein [Bacteroides caecigallinarum]